MSAVLSVRDLKVHFRQDGGELAAVDGVSFELGRGEVVGLVGESGCGKTATASALMGLLQQARVTAASIRLGETELTSLDERAYRRLRGREMSMIFQEPLTALDPVHSVGSQLTAVVRRHRSPAAGRRRRLGRGEAREIAADMLRRMGLGDAEGLMRRYPHELSGGMRQRILIAMAMVAGPRLLIADEPTTALDVTTQAQVLDELLQLGRGSGTSILFITHDLGVAARICERLIVMKAGRFVESAPVDALLARPAHPYTAELLAAVPRIGNRPEPRSARPGATLLTLDKRVISYPLRRAGRKARLVAVNRASLDLRRGEILGLVGESGCGKSTLAHSLVGLRGAEAGTMTFDGRAVGPGGAADWSRLRRRVQLVFQDPRASLSPRRTVGQTLIEPLDHFGIGRPAERRERVASALERVGLDPSLAARLPGQLSGGQRQRVALARALITEPDLIVADEPLSSLDVSIQARIIRLLRQLRDELGIAMLLVSHDLAVIRQLADRVAVMYLGRLVETAPADELFEHPAHPYTRALLRAAPDPDRRGAAHPERAAPVRGEPPSLLTPPPGCVFHTRCPEAMERCKRVEPPSVTMKADESRAASHVVNCLLYENHK